VASGNGRLRNRGHLFAKEDRTDLGRYALQGSVLPGDFKIDDQVTDEARETVPGRAVYAKPTQISSNTGDILLDKNEVDAVTKPQCRVCHHKEVQR
jgi:hypothetical protein